MFGALVRAIFGTSNDRVVRGLRNAVEAINALEPQIAALDDDGLKARTPWLKERIAKGESLDEVRAGLDVLEPLLRRVPVDPMRPTVAIPSYNGARSTANLTPLLACLLADSGLQVVVHGVTGDPRRTTTAEIMQLLVQLSRQGITIVLVTHEADVAAYASRQIHFRDGDIESDSAAPRTNMLSEQIS
jgi:hypothetical protein